MVLNHRLAIRRAMFFFLGASHHRIHLHILPDQTAGLFALGKVVCIIDQSYCRRDTGEFALL